jgi:hypothetical protein
MAFQLRLRHWAFLEGVDAVGQGYEGAVPLTYSADDGAQWRKGYLAEIERRLSLGWTALPAKQMQKTA